MKELHDILDICIEKGYKFELNPQTVVVSMFDGWTTKKLEAFYVGESSELRFMHFIPLKDMLEGIKQFEK